MSIDININLSFVTPRILEGILTKLEQIAMDQAAAVAALAAVQSQLSATQDTVTKISGETAALLTAVDNLTSQLANGGPLTAELEAAVAAVTSQVAAVKAAVEGVDAQVVDIPPG